MSKVRGVLAKCYKNDAGRFSISVDDTWYGCYMTDYTHLEGMEVEFEATQKGKYWNAKNVVAVEGAQPAAARSGGGAPQSADARQKSIVMQSSYKTAAETLSALIGAELVSLGAKAKAYDNALAMLDSIAVHIATNCHDPDRIMKDADDPTPEEYVPHKA